MWHVASSQALLNKLTGLGGSDDVDPPTLVVSIFCPILPVSESSQTADSDLLRTDMGGIVVIFPIRAFQHNNPDSLKSN
jgi:hypothetical protein